MPWSKHYLNSPQLHPELGEKKRRRYLHSLRPDSLHNGCFAVGSILQLKNSTIRPQVMPQSLQRSHTVGDAGWRPLPADATLSHRPRPWLDDWENRRENLSVPPLRSWMYLLHYCQPPKVQLLSNGAAIISTWVFNRTPWWVSPFLGGSSELSPILVKWALPGSHLCT